MNTPTFFAREAASLRQLKETLLMMASLSDRNFGIAIRSLLERDDRLAEMVEAEDSQLDELEMAVDEFVIKHVATQSPVATDCRFMLVASKISSNLEQIADQAVTIARRARKLNKEAILPAPDTVAMLSQLAEKMCRDSMLALIEQKPELAQRVIEQDKEVDELYKKLLHDFTQRMVHDSETVERALHWIFVVKCIERIADYAKNTAEEVYYLYKAVDIRHGSIPRPLPGPE
jgi:phosphate transport system protein